MPEMAEVAADESDDAGEAGSVPATVVAGAATVLDSGAPLAASPQIGEVSAADAPPSASEDALSGD